MSRQNKFFLSFAVLILVIYGQSLAGGFVFDDRGILEHQELLSKSENVLQVVAYPYWTTEVGLYRPTSLLSYWGNIVFLGGSAFSFHLVNLLLYFGICVLIYLLLKNLFKKEWLAYLTALIFLVLPIHTEVVANITGRLELLALFFSLLTLWELTRFDLVSWRAGLWALLAIGSKETAIAVLPLAFLILLFQKKSFKNLWAPSVGVLIYFLLRFLVLGPEHFLGVETSIIENPLLFSAPLDRIATALSILWMYVSKTFWPANLCSDYSFNQIPVTSFSSFAPWLGLGVLAASAVSFFIFLKKKPIISLASAIFFCAFLPVSNLLFPIGTIAGERLFFFPSLGFAVLLAYLFTQRREFIYLALIISIIFAFLSFKNQTYWVSEEKLFTHAAQCAPQSVLSLSNLGTVYYFKGDYAKAQEALEASRAIKPVYSKGLNNLGLVYWKEGRYKEAEEMYLESLKQKYPYPGVYENLVLLHLSQGDEAGALHWLRIVYPNADDSALRSLF